MKTFLKSINHIINLDPVDDILNNKKNIDEIILDKSKIIFSNRCYDNSYILDITKLLERTYIDIIDSTCHITLQAECLDISKYDIVANNIIQSINQDKIISKNQYFTSVIKYKPDYSSLKIGDNIIIIIGEINFMVNQPRFTASGTLFIPFNKNDNDVYYKIDSLSNNEKNDLLAYINNFIIPNLNIVKKYKRYKYFYDLLYPYKNSLNSKQLKNSNNLLELNTFGIVSSLNIYHPLDHLIHNYQSKDLDSDNYALGSRNNPIVESAFNIYNT
jgi:hypothetical protein